MKNYRTFIAVPVRVGQEFLRAREDLIGMLEGERISWVAPDRYHVTLRFIGATQENAVNTIVHSLRAHVQIPQASCLKLGMAGSFGPMKNPRVVWVGFEETTLLDELKTGVDHALAKCGIPLVDKPFRAHLTLGRVRSLNDTHRFFRIIKVMKDRFSQEVVADRLIFYQSEISGGGPVYTPLEELVFRD